MDDLDNRIQGEYDALFKSVASRNHASIIDAEENLSARFYAQLKNKSKNTSLTTIKHDNFLHTDKNKILTITKNFYAELYTPTNVDRSIWPYLVDAIPKDFEVFPSLNDLELHDLELENALKSMKSRKAPGPDGLTTEFYKEFWGLLKAPLREALNEGFRKGELSATQRTGSISLLCKDENNKDNLNFWRPLTLLNTDRKLAAKVLESRISTVLTEVINTTQTGGVRGRSIHDNLCLVEEVRQLLLHRREKAYLTSIDMNKAFDRVNHEFLFYLLDTLKLHTFSQMIQTLYRNGCGVVMINGVYSTAFPIGQGVRQGCPLSAPLFTLVIESLARNIQRDENIVGIRVPGGSALTTMQHSDDTNIFTANQDSALIAMKIVDIFCRGTGAKLNILKSKTLRLGVNSVDPLLSGLPQEAGRLKILGVVFGGEELTKEREKTLLAETGKRMEDQSSSTMSNAGRIMFLRQIILPKVTYPVPAVTYSKDFITNLERKMFNFFWDTKHEFIGRRDLKRPVAEGGLNFPDMAAMVKSLMFVRIAKNITNEKHPISAIRRFFLGTRIKTFLGLPWSNTQPHAFNLPIRYEDFTTIIKAMLSKNVQKAALLKADYSYVLDTVSNLPSSLPALPTVKNKWPWLHLATRTVEGKARDISWRVAKNSLPVRGLLFNYRICGTRKCPYCDKEETIAHAFYECDNSRILWLTCAKHFKKNYISLNTAIFMECLPTLKHETYIFRIVAAQIRAEIWKARNRLLFENKRDVARILGFRVQAALQRRADADFLRFPKEEFCKKWCIPQLDLATLIDTKPRPIVRFRV